MSQLYSLAGLAHVVLAIVFVVDVLRRRQDPAAMLVWVMAILGAPFIGVALYLVFGSTRVRRAAARRKRRVGDMLERLARQAQRGVEPARAELDLPADLAAIEQIGRRLSQFPATRGNRVSVFHEAEPTYAALEQAIRGAQRRLHLQYYIWQPDETGRHFRDLVIERARAGVDCRLLLDAVGCLRLTRRFTKPLTDAGVRLAYFMPLYPLRRRWAPHLRNHRKIAVIDGRVGFVGSQNIGDEYRGRLKRLSPWHDTNMRIEGPAALFLQETFAEDWLFATREALDDDVFDVPLERPGDCVVQVAPSGPDQDVNALGQILLTAATIARDRIRIATPYFVPYGTLRAALTHACYRGVRVQLVLPTRSDAPLVLRAGRSYYDELLADGAEIFEYDGGMLHSKVVTVDDRWCMLGSANMDIRSFRLNFEITALVYDSRVAGELSGIIDGYCAKSRRVSRNDRARRRPHTQVIDGAARLFAPLL